jgi:hypothetical protein
MIAGRRAKLMVLLVSALQHTVHNALPQAYDMADTFAVSSTTHSSDT